MRHGALVSAREWFLIPLWMQYFDGYCATLVVSSRRSNVLYRHINHISLHFKHVHLYSHCLFLISLYCFFLISLDFSILQFLVSAFEVHTASTTRLSLWSYFNFLSSFVIISSVSIENENEMKWKGFCATRSGIYWWL